MSCNGIGLLLPNRYGSNLSNEVMYVLVGQEAAKSSEIKVGGKNNFWLGLIPLGSQEEFIRTKQKYIIWKLDNLIDILHWNVNRSYWRNLENTFGKNS